MLSTKGLTMPEARFKEADGRIVTVQLPDTKLAPGAVHYDEARHRSHLVCACCDAPVHFRPGSATIGADNLRGPRPHFASNRRNSHGDDCTVDLRVDEGRDPTQYDRTLGYRINYNSGQLKEQFDVKSRLYARRPDKRITVNDEEILKLEARSVHGASDFFRLMRAEDKERLRKSIILNGTARINWCDFFIRHAFHQGRKRVRKEPRFMHILSRLQEFGSPQLVLMEFNLEKPSKLKMDKICAEAKTISIGKDGRDNPNYIIPRLYVEGPHQAAIARDLAERGRFLVLGAVTLRTVQDARDGTVRHYLNMTATDPAQVARADLPRIAGLVSGKQPVPPQLTLHL